MNKRKKLRLSCSLCLSFARNYALYLAAWNDDGSHLLGGQFEQLTPETFLDQVSNINIGNLIDIATLEWCKLFGNYNQEKLHWKKTIKDKASYKLQLLTHFNNSEKDWALYHKSILSYRNEHIAHLDVDSRQFVPYLEKALALVFDHYNYIINRESAQDTFNSAERNRRIEEYFELHKNIGRNIYSKINNLKTAR